MGSSRELLMKEDIRKVEIVKVIKAKRLLRLRRKDGCMSRLNYFPLFVNFNEGQSKVP